jgi:hypothetical protein
MQGKSAVSHPCAPPGPHQLEASIVERLRARNSRCNNKLKHLARACHVKFFDHFTQNLVNLPSR